MYTLGYTIHMANSDPKKNFTVNFKGLLLGDGLVNLFSQRTCECILQNKATFS